MTITTSGSSEAIVDLKTQLNKDLGNIGAIEWVAKQVCLLPMLFPQHPPLSVWVEVRYLGDSLPGEIHIVDVQGLNKLQTAWQIRSLRTLLGRSADDQPIQLAARKKTSWPALKHTLLQIWVSQGPMEQQSQHQHQHQPSFSQSSSSSDSSSSMSNELARYMSGVVLHRPPVTILLTKTKQMWDVKNWTQGPLLLLLLCMLQMVWIGMLAMSTLSILVNDKEHLDHGSPISHIPFHLKETGWSLFLWDGRRSVNQNSTLAHWCIKPKPSVASEIARILFFPQNLPVKGIWVRSVRFSAGWVGGDPYSFSMLFGICLLSHLGCAGVPKHRKWRHLFWDSAWKIMSFNHSMRCWIICGVKVGGLNSKRWSVQNPIYCETSKALCHLLWNDVKRL